MFGSANEIASKQLVYVTTFVQGVSATTRCIMNGHYAKAVAMLKQAVEIFARVREIPKGSDVEGKTLKVGHLPKGFRMIHGVLNELVHRMRQSKDICWLGLGCDGLLS